MPNIKFSHPYPKLWNQVSANLIAVRLLDAAAVQKNDALLNYDTFWEDGDGCGGMYQLPKYGKLIQLIFIGNKDIPFCTLRRYDERKHEYYLSNLNHDFAIVIGEM